MQQNAVRLWTRGIHAHQMFAVCWRTVLKTTQLARRRSATTRTARARVLACPPQLPRRCACSLPLHRCAPVGTGCFCRICWQQLHLRWLVVVGGPNEALSTIPTTTMWLAATGGRGGGRGNEAAKALLWQVGARGAAGQPLANVQLHRGHPLWWALLHCLLRCTRQNWQYFIGAHLPAADASGLWPWCSSTHGNGVNGFMQSSASAPFCGHLYFMRS
jgi:hypothetical protein